MRPIQQPANCLSCTRASREDRGDGSCARTEHYAHLRLLPMHDCVLFRPKARARWKPERPDQGALF